VRRAALALLGTAIGTSLLVGAKLGTPTKAGVQDAAIDSAGDAAGDEPDDSAPDDVATAYPTVPAPTTAPPSKGAGKTTAPGSRKTTRPTAAPKTTAPAPPAGGLQTGTFAGAPSTNEYGTIKVTITASGGKVTNVTASYPTSPSRTASINSNAIPKLRQEVLSVQSAKIDTVSGATYTSGSYKVSLKSALDKAKS
jgi:uncharacterized protein with FMN-binding domain